MTVRGYTDLVRNQPFRQTQPSTRSWTENEYRLTGSGIVCGWRGNRRSGVSDSVHVQYIHLRAERPQKARRPGDEQPASAAVHSQHNLVFRFLFMAPEPCDVLLLQIVVNGQGDEV